MEQYCTIWIHHPSGFTRIYQDPSSKQTTHQNSRLKITDSSFYHQAPDLWNSPVSKTRTSVWIILSQRLHFVPKIAVGEKFTDRHLANENAKIAVVTEPQLSVRGLLIATLRMKMPSGCVKLSVASRRRRVVIMLLTGRFITRSVHYCKNGRFITGHWSFHYSVDSLYYSCFTTGYTV